MNIIVTQSLPEEYYQWMEELQELDFVLVELTLYLDTHPDDVTSINQFNAFSSAAMSSYKSAIGSPFACIYVTVNGVPAAL